PEVEIDDVVLLDREEERWLRAVYTGSDRTAVDTCFHDMFEAEAERGPDRTAIVFGDQRLTYGELDACAERLAHRIRESGVGPETPVVICLERSAQMAPAVLAVLKAGGAGVMLEPSYPP